MGEKLSEAIEQAMSVFHGTRCSCTYCDMVRVAILAALAAAREEGRKEEREACAKECEAVVANEIKDECIGEHDSWASCCVSRIRARAEIDP